MTAAARRAAALGALLAAVALLALRRAGETGKRQGQGQRQQLAAGGYDLADGKGRVLMGRRLRVRPQCECAR
jgi:hypothetical protein